LWQNARAVHRGPALLLPLLLLAAPAPAASGDPAHDGPPRPHIVVFLADDLGWGDVGFHGSEIRTPTLDALAEGGVRLESFYVWPVCSPTRAAFLTGRYPIRYGLQGGVVVPHADYGLPPEERTLADALGEAGYRTAIVGKWHLGHARPEYLPTRRGFDHQYGLYNGQVDYYTHERDGGLDWHRDDRALREEGHATHLIAAEAVRLVEEHDPATPLFLYVPFLAPHTPLQPPPGFEPPEDRPARGRAIFGAMVETLDAAVGRVLAALERRGMRERTLVLFFSDNGANERFGGRNAPLRGGKYHPYEGGVRSPAVVSWPGVVPAGQVREGLVHVVDWYPTLLALAGASAQQPLPLDGRDQWPLVARGADSAREELLVISFRRWDALRWGRWKLLVQYHPPPRGAGARPVAPRERRVRASWLYDLESDPGETTNLGVRQPEVRKRLAERLLEYAYSAVPERRAGPPPPDFQVPAVWGEFEAQGAPAGAEAAPSDATPSAAGRAQ